MFTVTTRATSERFLNREAPSGRRLERPLVAPPPEMGSSSSQWGSGRVREGGLGGASLPFLGRLAWRLASAGRGAGADGAVPWVPADQWKDGRAPREGGRRAGPSRN